MISFWTAVARVAVLGTAHTVRQQLLACPHGHIPQGSHTHCAQCTVQFILHHDCNSIIESRIVGIRVALSTAQYWSPVASQRKTSTSQWPALIRCHWYGFSDPDCKVCSTDLQTVWYSTVHMRWDESSLTDVLITSHVMWYDRSWQTIVTYFWYQLLIIERNKQSITSNKKPSLLSSYKLELSS